MFEPGAPLSGLWPDRLPSAARTEFVDFATHGRPRSFYRTKFDARPTLRKSEKPERPRSHAYPGLRPIWLVTTINARRALCRGHTR